MTEGNVGIVGGDDQNESAYGAPKSPWKTSIATAVTEADSESWPALSLGQHRVKNNEIVGSNPTQFPNLSSQVDADDTTAPAEIPTQPTGEHQKFHGRGGNARSNRRPYSMNQNKSGAKSRSNVAPRFPPFPIYHPPIIAPYLHPVPPIAPGPEPRYPFPIYSGSYDGAQAFMPPVSAAFHPTVHPEVSAHDPAYNGRMDNSKEPGGPPATMWHNQRPAAVSNDLYLQHSMGFRHFSRPVYFAPIGVSPGAPALYYYPAPAPHSGAVRAPQPPHVESYAMNTAVPVPSYPTDDSREAVRKQIEYYFCDENLSGDKYLRSLMDSEGWVHISRIANFNRVRRLNLGIPFILDALEASDTIEIQGENLRRRDEWSKWVQAPLITTSSSLTKITVKMDDSDENKRDGFVGTTDSYVDPSSASENALQKSASSDLEQSMPELQPTNRADISLKNHNSNFELDNLKTMYSGSLHSSETNRLESSSGLDSKKLTSCEISRGSGLQSGVETMNMDLADKFSTTCLHDKDLESNKKMSKHTVSSNKRRVDKVEDKINFNGQIAAELSVVAQVSHTTEAGDDASEFLYAKEAVASQSSSVDPDKNKSESSCVQKNSTIKMHKLRDGHEDFRAHDSALNSLGVVFGSTLGVATAQTLSASAPTRDIHGASHHPRGDVDKKEPHKNRSKNKISA